MIETLNELVARYGYALIVLLVFIESVGVPIPGDTALVTAAALSARGTLSFAGVIASATAGAIAGGMTGYWIGLRTGTRLLLRHGRWLRLDATKLGRAEAFYARYGAATIFFGRFVALLRTLAVVLAGVARMPLARFAVVNAVASLVWSATLGTVGHLFGRNLPRITADLGRASMLAALFLTLAVAAVWGWRWFFSNDTTLVAALSRRWAAVAAMRPARFRFAMLRFARGEYLALHLLVGFVASLAILAIFGAVSEDIPGGRITAPFDAALARELRTGLPTGTYSLLRAISAIGSPTALGAVLGLAIVVLLARRRWIPIAAWLAAFVGAALLDVTLKLVVPRFGLAEAGAFIHGQTLAFPSGHALGAVVGYGMLAHLVASSARSVAVRAAAITLATVLVAAITVARLYLGAHLFSDAIAGIATGLTWLTACITGLELAERQRGPGETRTSLAA